MRTCFLVHLAMVTSHASCQIHMVKYQECNVPTQFLEEPERRRYLVNQSSIFWKFIYTENTVKPDKIPKIFKLSLYLSVENQWSLYLMKCIEYNNVWKFKHYNHVKFTATNIRVKQSIPHSNSSSLAKYKPTCFYNKNVSNK